MAIAFIVSGGINRCISGFWEAGLPLKSKKRITGRAAKVVGIITLIRSLIAAVVLAGLRGAVG